MRVCVFDSVLGSGVALSSQLLTLASIAAGIVFWVMVYRWQKVDLRPYALPIALWIVFGSLDILITARGTLDDPLREGNLLAREIFAAFGFFGPAIASVLWISLWSLIVLTTNKKLIARGGRAAKFARFASLSVFYSLAIGHVFGFSSWFCPLEAVSMAYRSTLPWLPNIVKIIILGCIAGGASYLISKREDA